MKLESERSEEAGPVVTWRRLGGLLLGSWWPRGSSRIFVIINNQQPRALKRFALDVPLFTWMTSYKSAYKRCAAVHFIVEFPFIRPPRSFTRIYFASLHHIYTFFITEHYKLSSCFCQEASSTVKVNTIINHLKFYFIQLHNFQKI